MKLLAALLSVLLPASAFAAPGLEVLKDSEWKARCRGIPSEAGKPAKSLPYVRLQSSYTFQKKDELIWWVKSYADNGCRKLHEATKYTLKCISTGKEQYAKCKQTKLETSKDGLTWESKPMVDHAGKPNVLEIKAKVREESHNRADLVTIGESEEPETEPLTRQ